VDPKKRKAYIDWLIAEMRARAKLAQREAFELEEYMRHQSSGRIPGTSAIKDLVCFFGQAFGMVSDSPEFFGGEALQLEHWALILGCFFGSVPDLDDTNIHHHVRGLYDLLRRPFEITARRPGDYAEMVRACAALQCETLDQMAA